MGLGPGLGACELAKSSTRPGKASGGAAPTAAAAQRCMRSTMVADPHDPATAPSSSTNRYGSGPHPHRSGSTVSAISPVDLSASMSCSGHAPSSTVSAFGSRTRRTVVGTGSVCRMRLRVLGSCRSLSRVQPYPHNLREGGDERWWRRGAVTTANSTAATVQRSPPKRAVRSVAPLLAEPGASQRASSESSVLDLSVVIPLRSTAQPITATLDSFTAQSSPPGEVIVVDDGSTDGGGDLARAYRFPSGSSPIVLRREKPEGVSRYGTAGSFMPAVRGSASSTATISGTHGGSISSSNWCIDTRHLERSPPARLGSLS